MQNSIRFAITTLIALSSIGIAAPLANAQYGGKGAPSPGFKSGPLTKKGSTPFGNSLLDKKNSRRNGNDEVEGTERVSASPEHKRCDLVLGQRARGSLAEVGNTASIAFRAPQGAVVRFSFGFVGKVGDSTVALLDATGVPLEAFHRDRRQFTLSDYEIPRSGSYAIFIRHDGAEKISFAMSSTVRYPEAVEARLELTTAAAVPLRILGFDERTIRAIRLKPVDGADPLSVSLTITDAQSEKIASLDGEALTPSKDLVPCTDEILIPNLEEYVLDVWLLSGGEKRVVDAKVMLSKPALGTGTVELRDR